METLVQIVVVAVIVIIVIVMIILFTGQQGGHAIDAFSALSKTIQDSLLKIIGRGG